jgi:transposase
VDYRAAQLPAQSNTMHLGCDNARAHPGKQVQAWLQEHPRCVLHFTPVHCSWLNQIEPWCSMLQRKRLRVADVASTADLQAKLEQCSAAWNAQAQPFKWTTKSVTTVMADTVPTAA